MGGRYTLLFACASERLRRRRRLLGRLHRQSHPEQRSTPERPTPRSSWPISWAVRCWRRSAPRITIPLPQLGEQLRERASGSGQEVNVDVYEGAGHAFFADYRPTYRPGPAARLWAEIVPFFAKHLQAG